jgi:F0F1-type ATP synthase assembly protein I
LTGAKTHRYTLAPMARPQSNDAWSGMGLGYTIAATLLGGMLAWGAVGYLVDRLVGTKHVFTGVGFILGAAGSTYLIYLKYGKGEGGGDGT